MSSINTNLQGLKLSNVLFDLTSDLNKRLRNLSSGAKVNNASDDSAAMFVNSNLNSNINGLDSSNHNIQIASNALSLAEGALNSIRNSLLKIRVLNLQALNSTYSDSSKNSIQKQINSLFSEIIKIQDSTRFNNKSLFVDLEKIDPNTTQTLNPSTTQTTSTNQTSPTDTTTPDSSSSSSSDSSRDTALTNVDPKEYEPYKNPISLVAGKTKYIKIDFNGKQYRYNISSSVNTKIKVAFGSNSIKFVQTYGTSTENNIDIIIEAVDDGFGHNIETNLNYTTIKGTNCADNITNTGMGGTIYGLGGDDTLKTTMLKGTIYGGDGDDKIYLNGPNSSAYGEDGDDEIYINNTNICAFGGNGNDKFYNNKTTKESVIDGGSGTNILSKTNTNIEGLITNIDGFQTDSQYIELSGNETRQILINGIKYEITNNLNKSSTFVYKINGDKSIDFGGAQLTIKGQEDVAHKVNIYGTRIKFYGGAKDDIITNYASYTEIYGQGGNNTLTNNNSTHNSIYGGNGNDTIIMNKTTNILDTGIGNNTVYFNYEDNQNLDLGTLNRIFKGTNTIYLNGKNIYLENYTNPHTKKKTIVDFTDSNNNTIYINGSNNKVTITGKKNTNFIINGSSNDIKCGDGNDYCTVVSGRNNKADGGGGTNYITDFVKDTDSDYTNFITNPYSGVLTFTYIGEKQSFKTEDGKKYTIINDTTEGNRKASNTLKYTYNPNTGQVTLIGESFTISASDGVEHNINLNGKNNVIKGSDKNDTILISNGSNNKIFGNDGNDTIISNTSNNKIYGNNGDDTIILKGSNNTANGNDGNDTIEANGDYNTINGGNGNDTITIKGSNNTADGDDGADTIGANGNNNIINVSDSNNTIYTIGDNNTIKETSDNSNTINLQGNNNNANLNNGDNTINIVNSTGANVTVGDGDNNIKVIGQDNTVKTGNGNNTVSITGNDNTANTGSGEDRVTISGNRNNVNTGDGDDQVTVNSGDSNDLDGGNGNDILNNLGSDTKAIHFEYLKKKTNPFSLQIGPHAYDLIELDLGFLLGNIPIDVLSEENARNSLDYIDSLLKKVNSKISEIGVYQNRLAGIEELNNITETNLSAFKSIIMDADIAKEMFYLTKDQIRNQACVNLINVNETVNRNLIIKLLGNL